MSDVETTTDHERIKKWAEKRGGRPATVTTTCEHGEPGVLRLDFEPENEPALEIIPWSDFFDKFDREKLVFLFQDETADGSMSRFHKFVDRDTAKQAAARH